MFLQQLMNQTNAPVLEQLLQFTAARHRLIAENMANVDTPGYRQKDLDLQKFQGLVQDRIAQNQTQPGDGGFGDVEAEVQHPTRGILFHDGNNRSMEQLASDQAKNAMMHNMVIELLRKQYEQMNMALREKLA